MNPRLSRPLLAVAISGALAAGGSFVARPAFADPGDPQLPAASQADPTETTTDDPNAPGDTDAGTSGNTDAGTSADTDTGTSADTDAGTAGDTDAGTPGGTDAGTSADTDPDTTAPVGTFTLNTSALWIGQSVSLTQGAVTDEGSTADQVIRVADWGDGTATTTLAPDATTYAHKYTKNGKFTVKVTYTDAAGNSSATSAPAPVAVTTPGKFKISKTTVWWHESLSVKFSSVPAGTTKIVFDMGDGWVINLAGKNQTQWLYYLKKKNSSVYVKGAVTLSATFYNKYGASSAIRVGKVTVKPDTWRPTTKIKKPGSSNRVKSWKYVKGTAKDKGSGVYRVAVFAARVTGTKTYCYSAKNTWKRVTSQGQYDKYCVAHYIKASSKGNWSLRLKGVAKGTLYVDATTQDKAGFWGKFASVKAKITRS